MAEDIRVRRAEGADASTVAALVGDLLAELGMRKEPVDSRALQRAAEGMYGKMDSVWAFLAEDGEGRAVGVITLSEGAAVYAFGRFGTISEIFIVPDRRSSGLGERLIGAAVDLAGERGWTRIEVGAPDVPRWQRTVEFYERNGFVHIGPRMKLPV